jgi:hypothetical protein
MFRLSSVEVVVLTDTLATTPSGAPHLLVTKCGIVPHLELVVAGTGAALLTERWRTRVYSQMLCRDIDMLDLHTHDALRRLWTDLQTEFADMITNDVTATVYHLGLSEDIGEYVGYVYRSTDDFASEPMAPGFRVKPAPEAPPLEKEPDSFAEWIELAHRLRAEQNAKPTAERIHIGGDLTLCIMRDRSISSLKIHRFEDFEEVWQEMNDALQIDRTSSPRR